MAPAAERSRTGRPRRLTPDRSLRRRAAGTVLIGGSPLRILRLSLGGARVVDGWCRREPVGDSPAEQTLADRLVADGLFHPVLSPEPGDGLGPDVSFTVVIPVKDDRSGLWATLDELRSEPGPPPPIVVVDDGSVSPLRSDELPSRVTLVHHQTNRGPGVARMTGMERAETDVVAFVDAGVEITHSGLVRLVELLRSEGAAAVAPRVRSSSGPRFSSRMARYEQGRSPLDLGADPGPVGPGRAVSYVPTACLVARADAIGEVGGFDPDLRFGEDVDLVWRLTEAGHRVRYEPAVAAQHPPRTTLVALARQRLGYGSAAAPLHRRHREAVAPLRTSWWSLAAVGLLLVRRPMASAVVAAGTGRALASKLPEIPDRDLEAGLLAARGHWWTLRTAAKNAVRTWWPLTAAGLLVPGARPLALTLIGLAAGDRLLDRPPEPLDDLAFGLIDDVSYGIGVWLGAWREKTLGPLLPAMTEWPPED